MYSLRALSGVIVVSFITKRLWKMTAILSLSCERIFLLQMSLKLVSNCPFNNMPALIKIIAWPQQTVNHYLNQIWPMHISLFGPQWFSVLDTICILTSSNGKKFRITGPLCGEFTCHRWFPLTKTSDAEFWYFLLYAPEQTVEQTIETPAIWDAIALIRTSQ